MPLGMIANFSRNPFAGVEIEYTVELVTIRSVRRGQIPVDRELNRPFQGSTQRSPGNHVLDASRQSCGPAVAIGRKSQVCTILGRNRSISR